MSRFCDKYSPLNKIIDKEEDYMKKKKLLCNINAFFLLEGVGDIQTKNGWKNENKTKRVKRKTKKRKKGETRKTKRV